MRLLTLTIVIFSAISAKIVDKLEPCKENNVCVAFIQSKCFVNGSLKEVTTGLLWGEKAHCSSKDEHLFARIDIEPTSLRSWKMHLISYFAIPTIRFDFGETSFRFLNGTMMNFTMKAGQKTKSSTHVLTKVDDHVIRQKNLFHHARNFIITSENKLIDFFDSGNVVFTHPSKNLTMNDARFPQMLDELTPCDISEIDEECDDKPRTCSNLTITHRAIACESKLWMRMPAIKDIVAARWKHVDRIRCTRGSWYGVWSDGTQMISPHDKRVRCSEFEPNLVFMQATIPNFSVSTFSITLIVLFLFSAL